MPERVGIDSPGAAGFEPHFFCVQHTHTPPNSPQRRSNSFSHGAKGLRKRAARPVGRYLLHAEGYSVSGPCPQPLHGVLFWFFLVFLFFGFGFLFFVFYFFALCGILSPSLPLNQEIAPGSEEVPQVKLGEH